MAALQYILLREGGVAWYFSRTKDMTRIQNNHMVPKGTACRGGRDVGQRARPATCHKRTCSLRISVAETVAAVASTAEYLTSDARTQGDQETA